MKVAAGSRTRLVGIALIFSAPFIVACALYFGGWRPAAVHPHGDLVVPMRQIADVELSAIDGTPVRFSALQPRWLLLYFISDDCAQECVRTLHTMGQIIAAQGKHAHRVRSVVVVANKRAMGTVQEQLTQHQELVALTGSPPNVRNLMHAFEFPAGDSPMSSRRIQLVDPLGNFMMSYSPTADPSGIRKDLARLLRASHIG